MSSWPNIKKELLDKIKQLLPEATVVEYERYLHIKIKDKSFRVFYGYGKIRVLDEKTRKFRIVGSVEEALRTIEELSK